MKNKFLTAEDRKTLKAASKVLKRIYTYKCKLVAERQWCDDNIEKDKGGKRWKAATMKYYSLLDEIEASDIDVIYHNASQLQC